jgi:pimeloyl-ACP methyl ester carboxylesterase
MMQNPILRSLQAGAHQGAGYMANTRALRYITVSAIGAVAASLWITSRYRRWYAAAMELLHSRSSVLQTACGPMEFARSGAGRPVLVVHGLIGGYDQGLAISELLALPQFEFIAVSRPGYLRTPLETGRTFDQQADAMAALLDELHIAETAVMGISAGGGPALAFARRHAARCTGLVLLSAVTKRLVRSDVELPQAIRLAESALADLGSWVFRLALHWNPRLAAAGTLLPEELELLRDRSVSDAFLRTTDTFAPLLPRKPGMLNDEVQIKSMPRNVSTVPCSRVLIAHGTRDVVVPYEHAVEQAAATPGARLLPIAGGGHMAGIFHPADIRAGIGSVLG